MKNGYGYTIFFVLVVSAFFTAFLAAVNAYYLPKIEKNKELFVKKAILELFELPTEGTDEQIEQLYANRVKEKKLNGMDINAKVDEAGEAVAYALPFKGPGLWGSISGYVAYDTSFSEIEGVIFTEHQETPGLGARIDEKRFRDQFKDIAIGPTQKLAYKKDGVGELDAITGATITSRAVLELVQDTSEIAYKSKEVTP